MNNARFELSTVPIDVDSVRSLLTSPKAGALVLFEGWVRNHNDGKKVTGLEYSAYAPLAEKEGAKIIEEAFARFEIDQACCVHRTGQLRIGDIAVIAGVSSAHREHAFQACQYLIDEVKRRVPIWKREGYVDQDPAWVNCHQE